MISSSKVVRVSTGFLVFLGLLSMPQLGDVVSAADEMKGSPCEVPHGQNATRAEQAEMQGGI